MADDIFQELLDVREELRQLERKLDAKGMQLDAVDRRLTVALIDLFHSIDHESHDVEEEHEVMDVDVEEDPFGKRVTTVRDTIRWAKAAQRGRAAQRPKTKANLDEQKRRVAKWEQRLKQAKERKTHAQQTPKPGSLAK